MRKTLNHAAQTSAKMFRWFIMSMLSMLFFAPLIIAVSGEV